MTGSEKINMVLEYFSLTPSAFQKKVGLKYVQNIYDIQKDKVDISKSMANKIVSAFPQIDKNWLLTGEGEMLKSSPDPSVQIKSYNPYLELLRSQQRTIELLSETIKSLTNK